MRIKRKGNIRSKTRAGESKTACSFSMQARSVCPDEVSRRESPKIDLTRRYIEMALPDGTVLTALAVEHCSDPSINVFLRKDGQNELICSIQYNPDYPLQQRLRVAAYRHDCDFACYEGPFAAEEIDDET